MNEFAPEESLVTPEDGRIDAISEAFLVAGDPEAIEEELEEPIEPVDV
ncbi:MAG: hypothetical protein Q7S52_05900 [bacterium]|nr:hypothetical protein [bacterium]